MASRPANILIVDDDPAIRQVLRRALVRLFAATVLEADDGLTAIERLASEPVDLIILDVEMRFMNGIETLEAIRESPAYGSIPVVMLTSTTDQAMVHRILELKVADFLVKPFTLDGIQSRVGPVLAKALANASASASATLPEPVELPWELRPASQVIVVDDSGEFRRLLVGQLKAVCRVEEAESNIVALRHCFSNLPDAVFLGNTATGLLSDTMFVKKLRAPDLRRIRLFRIAAADQVDVLSASGLYDGVITRTVDCESLMASLQPYLDAASIVRLILGPMSPCIRAMSLSATTLLRETLGTEVHLQPASAVVLPQDKRWVSAVLELRSGEQLWRLTMVWTHACALLATSLRLERSSDLVSEAEIGTIAGDVVVRIANGLRRTLFDRGAECSVGTPTARFVSARNADVEGLAKARGAHWYSTSNGASGALLQLAPH